MKAGFKTLEPPSFGGYVVALLLVVAAMAGLLVMQAQLGVSAPVAAFLLAVVVSMRLGGTKSGWVAIALSLLGFNYFLLRSGDPIAQDPAELVRLLLLGLATSYVVWVSAKERGAERESQRLLELVLATLPVGVSVTDRSGDIILSNAALRHIWGGRIIASGRQRWTRLIGYWHGSGIRVAPTEWASVRALSDGQTSLNEMIDIDGFDGRRRTIENSAAPIRDTAGSIIGAVVVNQDVTERVSAENALRVSASDLHHLSRRLLQVQEEERRHLSRELHDEFGQLLGAILLQLHAAKSIAGEPARSNLEQSVQLLEKAAAELRGLALELRPAMLETSGLEATLRWLAEQHRQRSGLDIEVAGHLSEVSGELAIAVFRTAQEALTNVVRHAQARRVSIELIQSDRRLELTISDDGRGFDVSKTLEQAPERGNLGLLGMKERLQILGGTLEIQSQLGRGTRIHASLPAGRP
jgi:signal transduction histidine kinase